MPQFSLTGTRVLHWACSGGTYARDDLPSFLDWDWPVSGQLSLHCSYKKRQKCLFLPHLQPPISAVFSERLLAKNYTSIFFRYRQWSKDEAHSLLDPSPETGSKKLHWTQPGNEYKSTKKMGMLTVCSRTLQSVFERLSWNCIIGSMAKSGSTFGCSVNPDWMDDVCTCQSCHFYVPGQAQAQMQHLSLASMRQAVCHDSHQPRLTLLPRQHAGYDRMTFVIADHSSRHTRECCWKLE